MKKIISLLLIMYSYNFSQALFPRSAVDAGIGSDFYNLGFMYSIGNETDGRVYYEFDASGSFDGKGSPPGTNIDEPFYWFDETGEHKQTAYVLSLGANYLFKSGLLLGGGLDYYQQKAFYIYKSTATGWDWHKHKEDIKKLGIFINTGYFLPESLLYFKVTASTNRKILLSIGYGINLLQ